MRVRAWASMAVLETLTPRTLPSLEQINTIRKLLANPRSSDHLLGGVLHVGRSVVCKTWRRVPVLGRSGEVLSDEPIELGPAFELNYFSSRVFWQTFEAGLRGESESDVTGSWRNIYMKF